MEWPAGLVDRMTVAENVYNAMQSFHSANPAETADWYKRHKKYGEIFDYVTEVRLRHGFWGR